MSLPKLFNFFLCLPREFLVRSDVTAIMHNLSCNAISFDFGFPNDTCTPKAERLPVDLLGNLFGRDTEVGDVLKDAIPVFFPIISWSGRILFTCVHVHVYVCMHTLVHSHICILFLHSFSIYHLQGGMFIFHNFTLPFAVMHDKDT